MKKEKGSPQYDGNETSKRMGEMGLEQGDMKPYTDEIQKPMENYSQAQFSKTLEYTERHNKFEGKEASDIRKQAYKGRYS